MKFTYQLEYNAFGPWHDGYIQYKKLKKLIKQQRQNLASSEEGATTTPEEAWKAFEEAVDAEMDRISTYFYTVIKYATKITESFGAKIDSTSSIYAEIYARLTTSVQQHLAPMEAHKHVESKHRKECIELFAELNELKNFVQLNSEGARKIVKKFDKFNGTSHCSEFMATCRPLVAMQHEAQTNIPAMIADIQTSYAEYYCSGDVSLALEELSRSLSELLVWDRGTIWHDLIKLERQRTRLGTVATGGKPVKSEDMPMVRQTTQTQSAAPPPELLEMGRSKSTESPPAKLLPLNAAELAGCLKRKWGSIVTYTVVFLVFILLLSLDIPGMPGAARRCLAVLWITSAFWCLGTLPLHITALAVPLLVVVARCLPSAEGDRQKAALMAIKSMWSGSQLMVLASFSLAAALSKLRLDKEIACVLLKSAGGKSRVRTLRMMMLVAYIVSAAVGNVAASVLCMSIVSPILDELPQNLPSTYSYGRAMLLSIAFACNIGGMTSPVASPQNVVAFATLHTDYGLSFSQWCGIAIPTSFLLLVGVYFVTRPRYHRRRASRVATQQQQPLLQESANPDYLALPPRLLASASGALFGNWQRTVVIVIVVGCIIMWLCSGLTCAVFGDTSLSALVPLVLLFSIPGLLTKADFLALPWDVCFLLAGGSCLALAVKDSKLLEIASTGASHILHGAPLWACIVGTVTFVTLCSTAVSHTAAANVLMPFICALGDEVVPEGVKGGVTLIAMPAALALSAGSALPVSSTPNVNATAIKRQGDDNRPWLQPKDFIEPGLITSLLAVVIISGIGALMSEAVA
ncbi:hypothetical protein FOL47_002091 [Perkinsus chesapeaki]|uniref:SPX domain-containing protein n=1 Tax=Perkinsus chesapeaki TaxID=330153 RepID=A0A7J6MH55_PERCH|nr:hypothetical protein FOL47_002091 [Perkinsus chesapeaki]